MNTNTTPTANAEALTNRIMRFLNQECDGIRIEMYDDDKGAYIHQREVWRSQFIRLIETIAKHNGGEEILFKFRQGLKSTL